jgi:hypothetical protein
MNTNTCVSCDNWNSNFIWSLPQILTQKSPYTSTVYYRNSQSQSLKLNDLACTDGGDSFSGNINKVECIEVATLNVDLGVGHMVRLHCSHTAGLYAVIIAYVRVKMAIGNGKLRSSEKCLLQCSFVINKTLCCCPATELRPTHWEFQSYGTN